MPGYTDLLKNAVLLDTETLGLARGSPIHEIAFYDFEKQSVSEYLIKPKMVQTQGIRDQDVTRLVSSAYDTHTGVQFDNWTKAIQEQIFMETKRRVSRERVMDTLRWSNPFLYEALQAGKHEYLLGKRDSAAKTAARVQNMAVTNAQLGMETTMEAMLGSKKAPGILSQKLAGKVVWGANVAFEAKMFGAQIGAMVDDVDGFKGTLETISPRSPDPFYVTGVEVNQARAYALQTGDWTGVWKAYKSHTPKAGETVVRDILDVTKAFMSYGRKNDLLKGGSSYFGTGIDLTSRLLGSLEDDPKEALRRLTTAEVHRAAEDVAISEKYVLEKMLHYTEVMEHVTDGTAQGAKYLQMAKEGSGPLAKIAAYFARLEKLAPELQRTNLVKRLVRAQQDLHQEGKTWQVSGVESVYHAPQITPEGKEVRVARVSHAKESFSNMDDFVKFLKADSNYADFSKVDPGTGESVIDAEYRKLEQVVSKSEDPLKALNIYSHNAGDRLGSFFKEDAAERLLDIRGTQHLQRMTAPHLHHKAKDTLIKGVQGMSTAGQKFAWAAGGMAAIGAIWSLGGGRSQKDRLPSSIVATNYQEWFERQQPQNNGLATQGMSKQSRRYRTDFGSPYQGPVTSANVLADQELLQRREKWLRAQYGAKHYHPQHGLFGIFGPFKNVNVLGRRGYSYFQGGTAVGAEEYQGLKGSKLKAIDLSRGNWKATVEDADTISVKRGGVRGAISSFFGFNRSYSFRMAGIDSTETSHGSTSYHAPQPYAESAKEALKSLIKGSKNLELVFNPEDTTYGRMMGALIKDGQNLNFQMVRQGVAAHLPYGKSRDAMIDYQAMKKMEEAAFAGNRGMWITPWARSFYDVTEASGRRLTFNTLTNAGKIAENAGTMSMISLMEQAQAQGQYSNVHAQAATALGNVYQVGKDKVQPFMMEMGGAHYAPYTGQLMLETSQFMKTKGTNVNSNKYSRSKGYGAYDGGMALDSMGTTNSVWTKRRLNAYELYNVNRRTQQHSQRAQMASMQRAANKRFGQSPIGHHQM